MHALARIKESGNWENRTDGNKIREEQKKQGEKS
jgi:hypothetical protein